MTFGITLYTNKLIPARFAGMTIAFIVLIRPKYRDDAGLHVHERVHVKQFWRSFGLSILLYEMSKAWRLRFEVEAYKAQMACYADNRALLFAKFIAENYNLDITTDRALLLLHGGKNGS